MNQRAILSAAWERYKRAHPNSPHLKTAQAFFDYMDAKPDICWDDLVVDFRRSYYDAFDEIVGTLLETDDPLLIYNATRFADFNNPRELEAAKKVIQQMDADKHQVSLAQLAQVPDLQPTLKVRGYLPDSVRTVLGYGTPAENKGSITAGEQQPQKGRKKGQTGGDVGPSQ